MRPPATHRAFLRIWTIFNLGRFLIQPIIFTQTNKWTTSTWKQRFNGAGFRSCDLRKQLWMFALQVRTPLPICQITRCCRFKLQIYLWRKRLSKCLIDTLTWQNTVSVEVEAPGGGKGALQVFWQIVNMGGLWLWSCVLLHILTMDNMRCKLTPPPHSCVHLWRILTPSNWEPKQS